jgi:hypothetical protein
VGRWCVSVCVACKVRTSIGRKWKPCLGRATLFSLLSAACVKGGDEDQEGRVMPLCLLPIETAAGRRPPTDGPAQLGAQADRLCP